MVRALSSAFPALSLTVGLGLALAVPPAHAQTARNVLLVVNAASADSARIGEHYARTRQIPDGQVLRLTTLPADPPDGIDRPDFDRTISAPVAAWLARHQAQDRILFIVLTKGIPLRINGGPKGDAASVDSELATLYLRMLGTAVQLEGPMPNPYYLGDRPVSEAQPFTREAQQIYLVTRLDGFTVDDVIGLLDRAAAPSRDGRFILDGKFALTDKGNAWLRAAAERLEAAGLTRDRIIVNQAAAVVTDEVDVLGYYSWGSNDPAIRRREFNLSFRPGAIGGMFVSTDGRTFREPPPDWVLPRWENKKGWFAGTPQSLAGDLIREGITGVSGHVSEPLLGNTIRPDILFPAYVAGRSLAEAYYLAMPSLSWMTVVVGDPLCAPFAQGSPHEFTEAIDPATDLPATFSRRRLEALSGMQAPLEARQLLLRAESRGARGDDEGAVADLERATELAPTLVGAQLMLAARYEAAGDYEPAMARYRAVLETSPDSALALNNLAYALAVRKGDLREALPMAERAHKLAPRSGVILDTLGWIHYLRGEARVALRLLTEAAKLSPGTGEIRLHLAHVHAAVGDMPAARAELTRALELDPGLRSDPQTDSLSAKIDGKK